MNCEACGHALERHNLKCQGHSNFSGCGGETKGLEMVCGFYSDDGLCGCHQKHRVRETEAVSASEILKQEEQANAEIQR